MSPSRPANGSSPSRNHPPRLRLCLCRRRKILQRLRPAGRPHRRHRLVGHHAPRRSRQPLARPLRPRRRGKVQAGEDGIRFLLVSGKPLQEPVAWYGPIVMNTQEQLREAYAELKKGTFLKDMHGRSPLTLAQTFSRRRSGGAPYAGMKSQTAVKQERTRNADRFLECRAVRG